MVDACVLSAVDQDGLSEVAGNESGLALLVPILTVGHSCTAVVPRCKDSERMADEPTSG